MDHFQAFTNKSFDNGEKFFPLNKEIFHTVGTKAHFLKQVFDILEIQNFSKKMEYNFLSIEKNPRVSLQNQDGILSLKVEGKKKHGGKLDIKKFIAKSIV